MFGTSRDVSRPWSNWEVKGKGPWLERYPRTKGSLGMTSTDSGMSREMRETSRKETITQTLLIWALWHSCQRETSPRLPTHKSPHGVSKIHRQNS